MANTSFLFYFKVFRIVYFIAEIIILIVAVVVLALFYTYTKLKTLVSSLDKQQSKGTSSLEFMKH